MALPVPAMRPTFQDKLPGSPADVAAKLTDLLERYPGRRAGPHLMLTVPEREKHFWSPYVTIELSGTPDKHTALHARFSPSPSLWTAIGFTYLALIVVASFALMWAAAQLTLGRTPHAAWVSLVCGACVALLWWVSLVGQRLAYDQMFELRAAIEAQIKTIDPTPGSG
ncbi:MAG: hypothetical protein AAGE65_10800 [Planctomycetota bacterium]